MLRPHPTLQEIGVDIDDLRVRLDLPQFLILIEIEIRMQIRACGYDCFGGDPAAVWHIGLPCCGVGDQTRQMGSWKPFSAAMKQIAAPSVRLRRAFIGIRPFDEAGDHRARSGRFDTSGKSPFVTNGRICDHLTEQVLEFLCAVHF